MELDDALYRRIQELSDEGNIHMDAARWAEAIEAFRQALVLLPPPKSQWEASMWLNASLGDAYYMRQDYATAKEALLDALNCPDGQTNPFVQLRLGQCLYSQVTESERKNICCAHTCRRERRFSSRNRRVTLNS